MSKRKDLSWKWTVIICVALLVSGWLLTPLTWKNPLTITLYKNHAIDEMEQDLVDMSQNRRIDELTSYVTGKEKYKKYKKFLKSIGGN